MLLFILAFGEAPMHALLLCRKRCLLSHQHLLLLLLTKKPIAVIRLPAIPHFHLPLLRAQFPRLCARNLLLYQLSLQSERIIIFAFTPQQRSNAAGGRRPREHN